MMLSPALRTRLFAVGGAVLAVVLGVELANGEFLLPVLFAGALGLFLLTRAQPLSLTTLALGAALFGYIVGNRGFAQVSLTGVFPLLPAELVLMVGGPILVVGSALRSRLPFRRDALNFLLIVWMALGTLRLAWDFRVFGFAAIRDYALVYYAGFFFLAQEAAREEAAARFLHRCLLASCVVLMLIHPFFLPFQNFFLTQLTFRGSPLIYYKDDLAGNFMALGSLLFFDLFERTRRLWPLLLSLALAAVMLTTNSRSSMLGLGVGALVLACAGRWRFLATLGGGTVVAVVAVLLVATVRNQSWEQTPLYGLYERTLSIVDPMGQRTYYDDNTYFKGDNNVFRLVWWRTTFDETWENGRWVGLGFGYDLAERFVREYFPANDEFSARSPHNVLLTVFARMGLLGFAVFFAILVAMAVRTVRALRRPDRATDELAASWAATWALLACACFGVVLEGPMGAVIFWTVLGLAHARLAATEEAESAPDDALPDVENALPAKPALPSPAPTPEVVASP